MPALARLAHDRQFAGARAARHVFYNAGYFLLVAPRPPAA
jgi:hypothetical protein